MTFSMFGSPAEPGRNLENLKHRVRGANILSESFAQRDSLTSHILDEVICTAFNQDFEHPGFSSGVPGDDAGCVSQGRLRTPDMVLE